MHTTRAISFALHFWHSFCFLVLGELLFLDSIVSMRVLTAVNKPNQKYTDTSRVCVYRRNINNSNKSKYEMNEWGECEKKQKKKENKTCSHGLAAKQVKWNKIKQSWANWCENIKTRTKIKSTYYMKWAWDFRSIITIPTTIVSINTNRNKHIHTHATWPSLFVKNRFVSLWCVLRGIWRLAFALRVLSIGNQNIFSMNGLSIFIYTLTGCDYVHLFGRFYLFKCFFFLCGFIYVCLFVDYTFYLVDFDLVSVCVFFFSGVISHRYQYIYIMWAIAQTTIDSQWSMSHKCRRIKAKWEVYDVCECVCMCVCVCFTTTILSLSVSVYLWL